MSIALPYGLVIEVDGTGREGVNPTAVQGNFDALAMAAPSQSEPKRGTVTATFGGALTYAITPDVPHNMGSNTKVLCSLSEYFQLSSVIATVQPYAVTTTKFAFLVAVSGPNPAAGTTVRVNYMAWA